jgi:aspartate/methionine/tyrosine aminotransferase
MPLIIQRRPRDAHASESPPQQAAALSLREAAATLRRHHAKSGLREIRLSIGEPQHATPAFIKDALSANLGGLASYPTTLGSGELRRSIAAWLKRRYGLGGIDRRPR